MALRRELVVYSGRNRPDLTPRVAMVNRRVTIDRMLANGLRVYRSNLNTREALVSEQTFGLLVAVSA